MRALTLCLALSLAGAVFVGCPDDKQDPVVEADSGAPPADVPDTPNPTEGAVIVFGAGIDLASGAALHLGDARQAMEQTHGAPDRVRDMGPAGVTFAYDDLSISGALSGTGADATVVALHLHAGFLGETADGLGLSSTQGDIEGALGGAVKDPFLGVWIYAERGLAFDWDGETLRRVTLRP